MNMGWLVWVMEYSLGLLMSGPHSLFIKYIYRTRSSLLTLTSIRTSFREINSQTKAKGIRILSSEPASSRDQESSTSSAAMDSKQGTKVHYLQIMYSKSIYDLAN